MDKTKDGFLIDAVKNILQSSEKEGTLKHIYDFMIRQGHIIGEVTEDKKCANDGSQKKKKRQKKKKN